MQRRRGMRQQPMQMREALCIQAAAALITWQHLMQVLGLVLQRGALAEPPSPASMLLLPPLIGTQLPGPSPPAAAAAVTSVIGSSSSSNSR